MKTLTKIYSKQQTREFKRGMTFGEGVVLYGNTKILLFRNSVLLFRATHEESVYSHYFVLPVPDPHPIGPYFRAVSYTHLRAHET